MRIRRLAALLLLLPLTLVGCGPGPVTGQSGTYPERPKQLRLAGGDTFPVYRVKYWVFTDGSGPSLQLEYAPPFSVRDTAAVRCLAYDVWPGFVPYVEAASVSSAILTPPTCTGGGTA